MDGVYSALPLALLCDVQLKLCIHKAMHPQDERMVVVDDYQDTTLTLTQLHVKRRSGHPSF